MNDDKNAKPPVDDTPHHKQTSGMVFRETVESFAVALILAFLFRAFVAEAFVIPTGSMAPTLMGAHKDVSSIETGFGFQCGASGEFETETGRRTGSAVVGGTCPLSRFEQPMDLKKNANHQTFSGDRILVSKFSYLFTDPKRWDVVVFKFPENARQNYIKRCIGLPNETIRITQGDIYVCGKEKTEFTIARKPPNVLQAMLQPIADTGHLAKSAVAAGVPSSWQPSPPIGDGNLGWGDNAPQEKEIYANGWTISQTPESWSARCVADNSDEKEHWIRYYHRVLSPRQWTAIKQTGKPPAPISPYSSRLISDFTSYNAAVFSSRQRVYDERGRIDSAYSTDWLPNELRDRAGFQYSRSLLTNPPANIETDGKHWVGDLAVEFDVRLEKGNGAIKLDLVEAGVHYLCTIDVSSGQATLSAVSEGKALEVIEAGQAKAVAEARAATNVRGGRSHRLQFANVDNALTLWVDGKTVDFSPSNRIVTDSEAVLSQRRPKSSPADPMDAAPIGLAFTKVSGTVRRAQVWRDVYYIADRDNRGDGRLFGDAYVKEDRNLDIELRKSLDATNVEKYLSMNYPGTKPSEFQNAVALDRDILFSTPSLWSNSPLFSNRAVAEFVLEDDQFFPMGDNSPASSDARAWSRNFVPRRLLIGRAVVVFWPHVWMKPIPFLPNLARIGLIR